MSEEVEIQEIQEVPVEIIESIEPIPVPVVELPELIYRYQPTDEDGNPMGGEQVLKYHNHDELVEKIRDQNVLLTRKLREVTRKNRLGIHDPENLPENVKRFPKPLSLQPRELTPEERVKMSRDILDPERFDEVQDEIFASKFGAKPTEYRNTISDMQQQILILNAKQEVNEFIKSNPDYYVCERNRDTITNWMLKNDLDPLRENFQLAYDTLREHMVMPPLVTSVQIAPPPPEPLPEPEAVITVPEPTVAPTPRAPIGTGITKSQSTNVGPSITIGDDIVYEVIDPYSKRRQVFKGMDAINAMSGEEYKRRINNDKTFLAKVDKLEREVEVARRNAR